MRSLTQERRDLIDAIVAEGSGQITAALLEKDEHVTDALEALFELKVDGVELAFCGGTSLSKGFGLIDRMSEDVDIKVIVDKSLSRSKMRTRLSDFRAEAIGALSAIGLAEDTSERRVLNEGRYAHTQWVYERSYEAVGGLRPNLQLEFVARTPQLSTVRRELQPLADRLIGRNGKRFEVPVLAVAETVAEKVLSFLRRFAQHRDAAMKREWDAALVRHIHDVHCAYIADKELLTPALQAFRHLVEGDRNEFKNQHAAFAEDPVAILTAVLGQIGTDEQTIDEYERHLLPLIYGPSRPAFGVAFESFRTVSEQLIASLPKETLAEIELAAYDVGQGSAPH